MNTKKGAPYSRRVRQASEAGKASGKARKAASSPVVYAEGLGANIRGETREAKRQRLIEEMGG